MHQTVVPKTWTVAIFAISADKPQFSGSTWQRKWEDVSGISIANPAVTSWSKQRLDIVVVGSDRSLWHRAWDFNARDEYNGWSENWEPLNGSYLYSPAMVSWSANRLDIFAIDLNSSMVFRAWEGDH
jgi:serine protease AprX